jgi:hypothetical protein
MGPGGGRDDHPNNLMLTETDAGTESRILFIRWIELRPTPACTRNVWFTSWYVEKDKDPLLPNDEADGVIVFSLVHVVR